MDHFSHSLIFIFVRNLNYSVSTNKNVTFDPSSKFQNSYQTYFTTSPFPYEFVAFEIDFFSSAHHLVFGVY